ncbi:hypothetical protein MPSEU_001070000 [Mayamaea pseudoterrestris]|nr:hypothetical protein MPSEU_001070000 [Mayamaea pseudoterrestris]
MSTEFMHQYDSVTCYALWSDDRKNLCRQPRYEQSSCDKSNWMRRSHMLSRATNVRNLQLAPNVFTLSLSPEISVGTERWNGPIARIYFPDDGNAALARRDWLLGSGADAMIPACCQFSSCGGVQSQDISKDEIIFFFCPNAAEGDSWTFYLFFL